MQGYLEQSQACRASCQEQFIALKARTLLHASSVQQIQGRSFAQLVISLALTLCSWHFSQDAL